MRLRRTRWTAIGAVVAATIAGGGVMMLQATGAESSFVPVTPTRVLDTRINVGLTGKFVHDTARLLTVTGSIPTTGGTMVVVPTGATAVVMNVTVVGPSAGGFVSVRPGDAAGAPATSNLNFSAGAVVPNAVTVELPAAGDVNLYYFGSAAATTDLLIDIVGYYIVGAAGAPGADGSNGVSGSSYGRQVIYSKQVESGDLGGRPSIAIGADGLPIIAHRDDSTVVGSLRVTHCKDTACATTDTPVTVASGDGWDLTLAIGTDGLPIIAHQTGLTDLRMTHCSDLACGASTFTTYVTTGGDAIEPSIAIGSDGFPIVAHRHASGELRVTHCNDVACTSATTTTYDLPSTDTGRTPSVAIGTDGLPIIVHQNVTAADLLVTHCDNVACTTGVTTSVDTTGVVGADPSIAIGTDGLPIIAHRDDAADDLRVTHCSDVACTSATHTTVDVTADAVGIETDIAIGIDGLAVIAHKRSNTQDLRLSHCTDVACTAATTTTAVTSSADGEKPSIAIGRDGHVIIAHRSSSPGAGLHVTKFQHMSWTVNGWES